MRLVNEAPDRRRDRKARKEARELADGKRIEVEAREPYRKPASEKLSRKEAHARALIIFGPKAFARKSTKTEPGERYQIGIRSTVGARVVEVIGSGKTWREATKAAVGTWELGGWE